MKKNFLLVCALLCCLSSFAQVRLFPSTSSITAPSGGGSVPITVIASGESNTGSITLVNYAHNVSSSPSSTQFDATTISGARYYNVPVGGPPTSFSLPLTISGTISQSYNVTYHIFTNVYNSLTGYIFNQDLTFTITINPPPPPTTFWNVIESSTIARSNCSVGQIGSSVVYTVQPHTFSSTISQIDANNQALSYISSFGPAYANNPANGATCTCPTTQISNVTIDGNPDGPGSNVGVSTGGSSHLLKVTFNSPALPLANYAFTGSTDVIPSNEADGKVVTSSGNTSTVTQEFYYAPIDDNHHGTLASPLTLSFTNACGTVSTYVFYFHWNGLNQ